MNNIRYLTKNTDNMENKMFDFARHCMMMLIAKDDPDNGMKIVDVESLMKIEKILNDIKNENPSTGPMTRYPETEMDKCVSCGKDTKYPKNMHVDLRNNYIEGTGQLCDDCANKIYKHLT